MEKLEEIFRAEENARHVAGEARDRAREIRAEGQAESELLLRASIRDASAQADTARAAVLREAEGAAASIERDAEAELAHLVARAETRIPSAVERALRDLVGRD